MVKWPQEPWAMSEEHKGRGSRTLVFWCRVKDTVYHLDRIEYAVGIRFGHVLEFE